MAVTADRPIESRGVAAPQTIDQVGLFGELVRFATDLGAPRHPDPDDRDGPQRAARAAVGQAIGAAVTSADEMERELSGDPDSDEF